MFQEREKEVKALLGGLTNICLEGESPVSVNSLICVYS